MTENIYCVVLAIWDESFWKMFRPIMSHLPKGLVLFAKRKAVLVVIFSMLGNSISHFGLPTSANLFFGIIGRSNKLSENNVMVLVAFLFSIGCQTSRMVETGRCRENEKFRKRFFASIKQVENYMDGKGEKKAFQSSIRFISKYTHVSSDKMLNYNGSYATYENYQQDKQNWINWYQGNRCNDIR